MNRLRILLGLFLIFPVITGVASAGEAPVRITGDRVWGDSRKQLVFLQGKIRIVQDKTIFTTDQAEIDLDHKTAKLKGNVVLTSGELTIRSGSLEYDLKQKTGRFKKHVSLKRRAVKDRSGKETKEALDLTTEELFIATDTKNFTARGDSRVRSRDFTGSAMAIEYDDQQQTLHFRGQVRIVQGSTTLNTEDTVVDLNLKILRFEEPLESTYPDLRIASGGLEYDYDKKTGTFRKDVMLERTAVKGEGDKQAKDPFKLTCSDLYFDSETQNFTAKNQARLEHREFTGSADSIEYDDRLQQLTFKGHAYIKRPEGEEIKGDRILIDLRNQNFRVQQDASLRMQVQSE